MIKKFAFIFSLFCPSLVDSRKLPFKTIFYLLLDSTIAVWDFAKLTNEAALEDVNVTHNPDVMKDSEQMLLGNYRTKNTPVLHLHFTRRNLLLASGPFEG